MNAAPGPAPSPSPSGAAAPAAAPVVPEFVGQGLITGRSWWRSETDEVPFDALDPLRPLPEGHPGGYEASPAVVDAVNTALLLRRPLLLTGRPGTGKTELAERIAYELGLGAVLRYEAQSLSEANDLFYRYDFVGQMVAAKAVEGDPSLAERAMAINFVHFGPLGHAILRSAPELRRNVPGLPAGTGIAQRSVVLIDEIDKASRDFPNDLLGSIARMSFRVREVPGVELAGAARETPLHPIVIITSNSERDLPAPFLRRCIYVDVPDPTREQLASIVGKRLFGGGIPPGAGSDGLPTLYSRLLDAFLELRADPERSYRVGTSEMLDLALAAQRRNASGQPDDPLFWPAVQRALAAIVKHPQDREVVQQGLERWLGSTKAA